MGPYRHADQMTTAAPRHEQAGVTVISFLLLAVLFGILGFAVIKLVPLYIENMTISTVLKDMQTEMQNQDATSAGIRIALDKRFSVEDITIPREDVIIKRANNGYTVRIKHESRTPFFAGIWFLLEFDKQVEIKR